MAKKTTKAKPRIQKKTGLRTKVPNQKISQEELKVILEEIKAI